MKGVRAGVVPAVIAVPAIAAVLWLALSIDLPLARDQGIFAWVGMTILRGGLPYADAWEVKGPLVHALYALAILLFGATERAIRAFDLVWQLVALSAFLTAGRRYRRPLAGVAGFVLSVIMTMGSWWDSAQPDGWAGILQLWSTVILLGPQRSVRQGLIAGALIGAATLIKPIYVLLGILPLVWLAHAEDARRFRLLAGAAIGGAVPIGACLALYAAAGDLPQLWEVLFSFNMQSHVGAHHLSSSEFALRAARGLVLSPTVTLLLILAAVGFSWLRQRDLPAARLAAIGALAAALCAMIQAKFYFYHLLPYFQQLCLLAGFGIAAAADRLEGRAPPSRLPAWLLVVGAAVALVLPYRMMMPMALSTVLPVQHALGVVDDDTYLGRFALVPSNRDGYSTRDIREAAALAAAASAPGEPIYLWGFDALVYFRANRPAVSRFGFNYPMVVGTPEYQAQTRRELMTALARTPPRVILVQDDDANNLMPRTSRDYLDDFRELRDLLAERYAVIGCNQSFAVYGLKPVAPGDRVPAACERLSEPRHPQ
jgi:hypothetical protein